MRGCDANKGRELVDCQELFCTKNISQIDSLSAIVDTPTLPGGFFEPVTKENPGVLALDP